MLIKKKKTKPTAKTSKAHNVRKFIVSETIQLGQIVEMLVIAVALEFVIQKSGADRYLLSIDLRQLFIVLLSCAYGVRLGLLSALTESLFVVWFNMYAGLTWKIQLFNPDNWLKISIYFAVACIVGVLSDSYKNRIETVNREKQMADERYQVLHQEYNSVLEEKDHYKQALVSSRGEFEHIKRMVGLIHLVEQKSPWESLCQIGEQILQSEVALYRADADGTLTLLAQSAGMEKRPSSKKEGPFAKLLAQPVTSTLPVQVVEENMTFVLYPMGDKRLVAIAQKSADDAWNTRLEIYASLCAPFLSAKQEDSL